jgi:hypothetical protein
VARALHDAAAAGLDAGFLVAGGVGLLGALVVVLLVRPTARRAETPSPELTPAA